MLNARVQGCLSIHRTKSYKRLCIFPATLFPSSTLHRTAKTAVSSQNRMIFRYEVNSFSSQFVLKSICSHFGQLVLVFRSIRTHKFFLRPIFSSANLFNSYSFWSICSHFGQFVLTLKSTTFEGNIERKQKRKHPNITENKYYMRNSNQFTFLHFNV